MATLRKSALRQSLATLSPFTPATVRQADMAYRQGNVTPAQLDAESRSILTANRLDAIAAEVEARRQRDSWRTYQHRRDDWYRLHGDDLAEAYGEASGL